MTLPHSTMFLSDSTGLISHNSTMKLPGIKRLYLFKLDSTGSTGLYKAYHDFNLSHTTGNLNPPDSVITRFYCTLLHSTPPIPIYHDFTWFYWILVYSTPLCRLSLALLHFTNLCSTHLHSTTTLPSTYNSFQFRSPANIRV